MNLDQILAELDREAKKRKSAKAAQNGPVSANPANGPHDTGKQQDRPEGAEIGGSHGE